MSFKLQKMFHSNELQNMLRWILSQQKWNLHIQFFKQTLDLFIRQKQHFTLNFSVKLLSKQQIQQQIQVNLIMFSLLYFMHISNSLHYMLKWILFKQYRHLHKQLFRRCFMFLPQLTVCL
ncbi:hypothetical protein TTHERM_001144933 (macronuclear) [Tetrahymena thermophila SB210]|uniref:Uncharacterized protein n=1 Tax=Tetrahymena thermophila (strain SB210) TaxID=312017 RepID=W7XCD6_TETTS|nr:hypothetical protein TTHERM_001144933 [Tetrahymena thermophila SB210]EWS71406.1 hypothetical protein TTHERM_001144933 [Tetrahymena thermophila SB210]|eukprot:XP_012656058.1 hypothetical protein TTHERM_001144933 [Tetrahymena thermophila SB210]